MLDDFRHAASASGDGNNFAGHRFQSGQTEGFEFAGQEHDVRNGQFFLHTVLLAEEEHVFVDAFLHREPLGLGTVRAVANQQ